MFEHQEANRRFAAPNEWLELMGEELSCYDAVSRLLQKCFPIIERLSPTRLGNSRFYQSWASSIPHMSKPALHLPLRFNRSISIPYCYYKACYGDCT